jgi:regulator of PEP synthase PpsR (kinase-PPPase family)
MNKWIIAAHTAAVSRLDDLREQRAEGDRSAAAAADRGAISTETAVITALLVTAAIAVVAIIQASAEGWANSIPGS